MANRMCRITISGLVSVIILICSHIHALAWKSDPNSSLTKNVFDGVGRLKEIDVSSTSTPTHTQQPQFLHSPTVHRLHPLYSDPIGYSPGIPSIHINIWMASAV